MSSHCSTPSSTKDTAPTWIPTIGSVFVAEATAWAAGNAAIAAVPAVCINSRRSIKLVLLGLERHKTQTKRDKSNCDRLSTGNHAGCGGFVEGREVAGYDEGADQGGQLKRPAKSKLLPP